MGDDKKTGAGETQAVRVTSNTLIKKDGGDEPKAVLAIYEDFQCPHCGDFEKAFGPTITKLIDSGAIAADYYMVAILNSPGQRQLLVARGQRRLLRGRRVEGSLHAGSTRRCTPSSPSEGAGGAPRQRQAHRDRPAGRRRRQGPGVHQLAATTSRWSTGWPRPPKITATPTIKLNGEDYQPLDPRGAGRQGQGDRRRRPRTAARTAGATGPGPRSAVSVATPAPVEPTESAESPARRGRGGAAGQRVVGADRRCRRVRRGGDADDREDRDADRTRPTCRPAASTRCCPAGR